ncbi:MAG TPA: RluA family pseudouridine synthase [Polyangiaceae bacterium]|nr:RluA family pseudouridine synthase [Polyangiaceae bacterium]
MPDRIALVVPREGSGARLDRFLALCLAVSRSELQRWIAAGRVSVAGVAKGSSTRLREGDRVVVEPPPPPAIDALPDEGVHFDVLHVDDELVVVDKPAGVVVHPARGHAQGTLVNGLLALGLFSRAAFEGEHEGHVRPGIVHRLDKGTSGVMVVARTPEAQRALASQFRAHTIERVYEALVVGAARDGTFDTLHGRHPRDRLRFTTRPRSGKRAVTHVRVIARLHGTTHVACTLETGRTHQIRVHLAESGTPVLGDALYGKRSRDERVQAAAERLGHQALHARVLGFVHPGTGTAMRFETPPPEDFRDALRSLAGDGGGAADAGAVRGSGRR